MAKRLIILLLIVLVTTTTESVLPTVREQTTPAVIQSEVTSIVRTDAIFDSIVEFVIQREGLAYVNDPDINEESRMGITNHTYKRYYGSVNRNSIRNLKKEQAIAIYKKFYWEENNLDTLVQLGFHKTATALMDSEVNLGSYRANKMLQEVIGMERKSRNGKIDDATISAIVESKKSDQYMCSQLISKRRFFYVRLVQRKPVFKKYEKGWNNRLDSIGVFVGDV